MADQVFVQYRFTINQDGLEFSDAIVLPVDQYNLLSKDDINAIKQQRFSNWKALITNPPDEGGQ